MIIDRNSPIPQYFQLQTWLIEQIDQGIFKPNDKIPTEEEISRVTGLARATIRQAIQNLVNMGYLVRRRRLGTFVLERTEDSEKITIIGVLVPDIRSGYAPELARGAGDEAAKEKHSIILCNTDDSYAQADFHANRLIELSVSGVIFVPTAASDDKNRIIVDKFLRNNIPVVLADRYISSSDVDYVTTNNFDGAYELTEYLINRGHVNIAITLSDLVSTERQRLEGYKKALMDHRIPIDQSFIFTNSDPFSEERCAENARLILTRCDTFSALFAGHDRIAYVIQSVAKDLGIHIPEDLSLVGYDDLNIMNPPPLPLTTMHQPIYEMGQESMKVIMARIRGGLTETQQIVLKSYLIERASVISKRGK
jgi:GntR family transcriptional regulator of arabinose operon